MNISIDFDDTYTRDPELWDLFIKSAKDRGHTVYCVTARGPRDIDRIEVIDSIGLIIGEQNCIFTDGKAKESFCYRMGIRIDVWCDDTPQAIIESKRLFDY